MLLFLLYLVSLVKVTEISKWREFLTQSSTHPVTDQVYIVTAFGKQRKWACLLFVPVTTDKRMGKMPETNLQCTYNTFSEIVT